MKMLHSSQFIIMGLCLCVREGVPPRMQGHMFQFHPLGSDVPPEASSCHLTVISLCHWHYEKPVEKIKVQ